MQACVSWRIPSADVLSVDTSRCQQQVDFAVFEAMFGDMFGEDVCRWPFSLLSLQCDLQAPIGSGHPKEDDQFGI